MKKRIYGIYDMKTGNAGDICTMERDEDFTHGFNELLKNPAIPEYIVVDMVALCYGEIIDRDGRFPEVKVYSEPVIVANGFNVLVDRKNAVKEVDENEKGC